MKNNNLKYFVPTNKHTVDRGVAGLVITSFKYSDDGRVSVWTVPDNNGIRRHLEGRFSEVIDY